MADPIVVESKFKRKVQLDTGVVVKAGDLIYHNSTAYAFADASAAASHAQLVALEGGDGDATDFKDEIEAAPYAVIQDTDAPYTQDALQYLSETGTTGNTITETRVTTAGALRQVVGRAHSDELIEVELKTREVFVPLQHGLAASGEITLDSGVFHAARHLDAQSEVTSLYGVLPENAVELVKAVAQVAAEASAGTPTADIVVGSAIEGAQHDAVTADSSLEDLATEGAAADEMHDIDISSGFDATDIFRPGAQISVQITKDDAGTDNIAVFGGYLIVKVADV